MAAPDPRRKNERIAFPVPLHIRKPVAMDGKGVDIAAGGLGVDLPQAIAEGSAVELDLPDGGAPLAGTVRMVRPLPGGGFRLGIQFLQEDGAIVARARALHSA
jgi:hypothetical protein